MPNFVSTLIPVARIRVIAFNPMDQRVEPVEQRSTLMFVTDLMCFLPSFTLEKTANFKKIDS